MSGGDRAPLPSKEVEEKVDTSPAFSKDGVAIHCKVEELAGVHRVPPQLNMPQAHTSVQHRAVHLAPVCHTATPLSLLPARLEGGMLGRPGCWTRLQLCCIAAVGWCEGGWVSLVATGSEGDCEVVQGLLAKAVRPPEVMGRLQGHLHGSRRAQVREVIGRLQRHLHGSRRAQVREVIGRLQRHLHSSRAQVSMDSALLGAACGRQRLRRGASGVLTFDMERTITCGRSNT